MKKFKKILDSHLETLTEYGSGGALAIKGCNKIESILELNNIKKASIPNDLITYFTMINGYDSRKERELEDEKPLDIAYGMAPMDLKNCFSSIGSNGESDTYFPQGFIPILSNYGGDYIMINCIKESPTYGAIYDFTEGVGVNLIANSLSHFFECSTKEITTGFRVFNHDDEDYEYQSIVTKEFDEMALIYGNTPYFKRKRMDEQIIDWI